MNRVVLVGRLTKDPDLRYTPNGIAVATFTLAVKKAFANQRGERESDFISCVVWRKAAENVANYLKKGGLAGVDGRLQTRNYEGQDGKRVYVTEVLCEHVQFLEPKNYRLEKREPSFNSEYANVGTSNKNSDSFSKVGQPIDISDDDLPF
ncbi:single-stranded DNA-binding protein [Bacillus wiedmannii]|uniref:Single-stranded DNA-binding protein n=1 Tax=Bacillus wiedmannii TaxID=1890302 RepID=A0A2A7VVV4_9BACI|nr:single-stranded DNA-binding protein [Bacillus wiedmannii]PEJ05049.1 single-stranded DNA-binding protein [Bacillus wiedmannii]PHC68771.1 single-stranded DNA-binding protein [Bacillus wiedmannii]